EMIMRIFRPVQTNHLGKGQAVFPLLVILLFTLANARGLSAQTKAKTNQPSQSALREVLQTSFGSAVEVVTAFKPFYLTGDFNGDGAQDILIVVHITGPRAELAVDVKVYNPFERPKATFPADPSANPTLALAIIHGSKPGWQTPTALEKFLLFGQTPILILNYGRVMNGEPQDRKDLMELLTKRSTRFRGDGWPPASAKGDSIVLGTEATDSILYWNGKTYRWEEAAGGE
ncbi:MAG: hypothetical protein ACREA9_26740, partial [Pyrinomonadaceae bacterium]